MKLSVLDQSVLSNGNTAQETLQNTTALAQLTEQLGFVRFWVAEHHNTDGIAGTSPEILIAHLAAHTKKIKIGSGGVLLPQYSPFKVAENFKVLESLYPGRIDLGIGRSPGGNAETRLALTDGIRKSLNEFPRQVRDLQYYLQKQQKLNSEEVLAYPLTKTVPDLWLLGITHRGARLAAEYGTAFTFGHFISPVNGKRATEYYYKHFQPSPLLDKPQANICIFVICANTQEEAEEMALSQDMWLLSIAKGESTKILSPEEARKKVLTAEDYSIIKENRKRMVIGTKDRVREQLLRLSELYQTEEFMIICNVYSFEDKVKSYELTAELF
ncbi:LLM class flavin-dependent oxidoreductase [Cytobacillus gottheilii]|uniref:LLM class flavin-dependent oxidoreductase n=1 Tax=Cytobacillus gottheilii TaxID=859144 RepID=A0ABX8FHP2_9BACI|nr:LLM class flavin-dependent oxidoreductase [Cytobacillus gottheilii]QVY63560.1 LLM class flavin-dependent oxidoreductase [Cytobacillus gottheilii]